MASNANALRRLVAHFQIDIGESGSLAEVLQAALAAHEAWDARLREAIRTGTTSMTIEQAGPDDACTFGKWLYGAKQFRADRPECWQELHDLHERFLRNAAAVRELAVSGRAADANAQMRTPDFQECQSRLKHVLATTAAGGGAGAPGTVPS